MLPQCCHQFEQGTAGVCGSVALKKKMGNLSRSVGRVSAHGLNMEREVLSQSVGRASSCQPMNCLNMEREALCQSVGRVCIRQF